MDGEEVVDERPEIELRPQNPLDLRPEELEDLAAAVRFALPDYRVRVVAIEPRGYGVTWWEVLHITVPWADLVDTGIKAATGVIVAGRSNGPGHGSRSRRSARSTSRFTARTVES
jgi:pimeloyl-ACP methyl ester carboxylesterase